jgi:flagellar hook-associated protein 3 FlgL
MSIDRVATAMQSQYMLAQINNANAALNTTQAQVASGNVASDYTGYGDKTAALEAAQSAATRAAAYKSAAQTGADQANLQDTALSTLSSLADQLRQAVTNAVANNDGTTLMSSVQGIFDQAVQVLNTQDVNGNYLFGGNNNDTAPVTATTLSALSSAPSAASIFANGSTPASVMIGDGQKVSVGVLASDAGTKLMQAIKDVVDYNGGSNGPISGALNSTQSSFLSGEIQTATTASQTVNSVMANNGDVYNQLTSAVTHQDTLSTLYQGFASDIKNVDMSTAITNLNMNQTALQAALKVTSQLNSVSLLNYMGNPTITG